MSFRRDDDRPRRELKSNEVSLLEKTEKDICSAAIFGGWHYTSCPNKATKLRDGAKVCGIHARVRGQKVFTEA